jgi:Predicted outer membrane protein
MNNEQLIKSAHVWAVIVLVASTVFGIARMSDNMIGAQNSNQNNNSNSNTSGNVNSSRNKNANTSSRNAANPNATGEQAAMGNMNSADQKFVMDAALGGMMEVELGRWAAQKGTTDGVKQFGRRMVDDHSKANTELMSLASRKGITLPTALDQKHQAQITKITRMTGADFDRAYIKMMLSDHKKDVSEFEKQSTKGADADIKAFAGTTLPTLQEHLTMIQALSGTTGGGNSNSNSNHGGSKNSNGNGNSNRP